MDSVPPATITEGSLFTGTGYFVDPDPDTWTATVDYGDGSGLQALPLIGKTFNFEPWSETPLVPQRGHEASFKFAS